MKKIAECVHDYINTYPPLADDRLNVDCLPDEVGSYAIGIVPCQEWVKRYVDGSGEKQFLFTLSSRALWGEEIRQQLDNIGFFADFADWVEEQNRNGVLPDLGEKRRAEGLTVSTSGYLFLPGTTDARYQIQLRLTYFEKGE